MLYGSGSDLIFRNFDTGVDTITAPFVANQTLIVKAMHSGGNLDLSVNRVAVTPSVASGNTGDLAGTLQIGQSPNGQNGPLLELITFNTALSAANQAVVEAYLNSIWGPLADPWKRVSVLP
jgi:hypothetical protein